MGQGNLGILVAAQGHAKQDMGAVLQQPDEAQLWIAGTALLGAGQSERLPIGGFVSDFEARAIQADQVQPR